MYQLGDDPIIRKIQETGYPREEISPICPVCGNECSVVYRDAYKEVVGCDECLTPVDAWRVDECFREDE